MVERKLHQAVVKALDKQPRHSVDLLIALKSLVNNKVATSILVHEGVIPVLFSLLVAYRQDDSVMKRLLNNEETYANLPMLNMCLEVLRMVLDSGFVRQGDDSNLYSDIINSLNLQAFKSFLDMVAADCKQISRSLRSSFIMYLCDKNVANRVTRFWII